MEDKEFNKKRTIIYSRVSSLDQVSTKEQTEDQLKEATKNNEEIIDIVEEKRSAKDKKGVYDPIIYMKLRPDFYNIYLRAVKKEFDILRFWKWDRFARSEFQAIISTMFEDNGVKLKPLRDSEEKIVRDVVGATAKYEIDKIKERVELRQQSLKKQGHFLNRPPFGYYIEKQKLPNGKEVSVGDRLLVSEKEAKTVIEIFNLKLKKTLVSKIAKKYRMNINKVNRILSNPTYCGFNIFRKEVYRGKHEKIIDIKTFKKINPNFEIPNEENK